MAAALMHDIASLTTQLDVAARVQRVLHGCLTRRRTVDDLLDVAELTSHLAWRTHSGLFALSDVESALQELSAIPDRMATNCANQVAGRTLHVLTEAYTVGGHTKLAYRWMEAMDDEQHAVVLVRQRTPIAPEVVAPHGRGIPVLDLAALGVRKSGDRLRVLLALFGAAHRVMLHIHPDDACSVAAAYQLPRADIRFINHADHVAWLGAGLPIAQVNLRQSATDLSIARRGIAADACVELPLPLGDRCEIPRKEARARLGFGDREILILTVASGYKYCPIGGRSLTPLLHRALSRPEVRLLAIGPHPDHSVFSPLIEQYPGRVRALGPVIDVRGYRAAADIYLDSYPFGSCTSMLESAVCGTPVLAYQPDYNALGIMYSESPCLPREAYATDTLAASHELLDQLLERPAFREAQGDVLSRGVAGHLSDAFRITLAQATSRQYSAAAWRTPVPRMAGTLDALIGGLGENPCTYAGDFHQHALSHAERLLVHAVQLSARAVRKLRGQLAHPGTQTSVPPERRQAAPRTVVATFSGSHRSLPDVRG